MGKFIAIGVIAIVALAAVLLIFGPNSNSQPAAQNTQATFNVFGYNCTQLEYEVNLNMVYGSQKGGGTAAAYYAVVANDYLQVMELQGCKIN